MNDNRSISAKGQRNRFVALLIFDILTATVGFGLVFVAVGHDANSATECTSLNGLCAPYSLNYRKKDTGGLFFSRLMAHGSDYCTGVTTGPFTTSTTGNILISGLYALTDNNVTGEVFSIKVEFGVNVPVTTWQLGQCNVSNAQIAVISLYAPITGTIFSQTFAVNFVSPGPNTYYAAIDLNAAVNDVSILSRGTTSHLQVLEIK